MLIEQDITEIRSAYAVQSRCELKRITLSGCKASRYGDERNFHIPFVLSFVYDCKQTDLNESRLVIDLRYTFEGKDSSEPAHKIFEISCSYELTYQLSGDTVPTQEEIDAFKRGNAIFNSWPYVREFVQQTAARMGFQPPPVPLLRIQPKKEPAPVPGPALSESVEQISKKTSRRTRSRKKAKQQ